MLSERKDVPAPHPLITQVTAALREVTHAVSALHEELYALKRTHEAVKRTHRVFRHHTSLLTRLSTEKATLLLRQRRLELGLPQHAVAKEAGVARATVASTERGERQNPITVDRLLAALDRLEARTGDMREAESREPGQPDMEAAAAQWLEQRYPFRREPVLD